MAQLQSTTNQTTELISELSEEAMETVAGGFQFSSYQSLGTTNISAAWKATSFQSLDASSGIAAAWKASLF